MKTQVSDRSNFQTKFVQHRRLWLFSICVYLVGLESRTDEQSDLVWGGYFVGTWQGGQLSSVHPKVPFGNP